MAKQFIHFFRQATGHSPYPYQTRLALAHRLPQVLSVPTGLGKTAAFILAWLWRRFFAEGCDGRSPEEVRAETPRRLVICLPMRTLVDQTVKAARKFISKLETAGLLVPGTVKVYTLMGGEVHNEWDISPEQEAILVGTQDQLLSRALNRGYAMSRFRWPMHFAFLNSDTLWVMDEIQLMGVGAMTSAQLQAFRESLRTFGPTHSIWASATIDEKLFNTVDHRPPANGWRTLSLDPEEEKDPEIRKRTRSSKILKKAVTKIVPDEVVYAEALSQEILSAHVSGTLTLVVLNSVSRAQALYRELLGPGRDPSNTALIHSRFRQPDRKVQEKLLDAAEGDRIIVATQAIEAGVDVSAFTLFTELAPWSSIIQRFGRLNRYGEHDGAQGFWIDFPSEEELASALRAQDSKLSPKQADSKALELLRDRLPLPYDYSSLGESRAILQPLQEASSSVLAGQAWEAPEVVAPVLRRKDLLDLFDTTPDLLGNEIDISQYVRNSEETDIYVFWRDFVDDPPADHPIPNRQEICAVPIGAFKRFLGKDYVLRWDHLSERWRRVYAGELRPGQTLLLECRRGGYDSQLGWTGQNAKHTGSVPAIAIIGARSSNEGIREKAGSAGRWILLADHASRVSAMGRELAATLALPERFLEPIATAGWRHDHGKTHPHGFQGPLSKMEGYTAGTFWAKFPKGRLKSERPYFRHELASALAWLKQSPADDPARDLIAYLMLSHHGRLRTAIRSIPGETAPGDTLFACGIHQGDPLPEVDLGNGIRWDAVELDLTPMRIGEGPLGPSWTTRTRKLIEELGPFRLAFLEALVRVADWRVSREEGEDDA